MTLTHRDVGLGLLLAEAGLARDRDRAVGELAGPLDVAELALEHRQVAADLGLELAVGDVLDDLERVLEPALGLLEVALLERELAEVGQDQRAHRQGADVLGLAQRGQPAGPGVGQLAELERQDREVVAADDLAPAIAGGGAQLERIAVARHRGVELAAVVLQVAQVRQRRRDRALVAALAAPGQRLGDLGERLVVAAEQGQDPADVVERPGDTALVGGRPEQLVAALEVLERQAEVALAAPDPAHLVERDRRLGLGRDHPRQPQHPLERAQRGLEVADQLVDRAEVVPQVDAGRDVGVADADQGPVVEPDRALVLERGPGRIGRAPVAQRGLARRAAELEVAGDVLLGLAAAPLGPHLEPAGAGRVVAPAAGVVDRAVDQGPQVGVREVELALAGHRRALVLDQPLALDQVAERRDHRQARVVARRGDLRQGRPVGIRGRHRLDPVERDDRVDPADLADDRGHLEDPALGRLHDREPGRDQLLVGPGQGLGGEPDRVEAPAHAVAADDALALEEQPDQLVDRARRAAERAGVADQARRHLIERQAQLAQEVLGLDRRQRAEHDLLGDDVALAEARVLVEHRRGRGRDQQDRRRGQAGGEVVEQVDGLGPGLLEVLDREDQRPALGVGGEEAAQGQERAGLELLGRAGQRADHRAVGERDPEEVGDQVRDLGDPGRRQDLGDAGLDAVAGLVVGLARDQAEAAGEQPRDRAVGGALVGRAGPDLDLGMPLAGGAGQLGDQPALAHARIADDDREGQAAFGDRLVEGGEQRVERRAPASEPGPELVRHRGDDGLLAVVVAEQLAGVERGDLVGRQRDRAPSSGATPSLVRGAMGSCAPALPASVGSVGRYMDSPLVASLAMVTVR